jgi:hypothetical protein
MQSKIDTIVSELAMTSLICHLRTRHLQIERYNGVLVFDDVVIFLLWNLSGQLCGYQQYRPDANKEKRNDPREGRYYMSLHGDKNEKPIAVWGLETFHYRSDILFITEGIFDACRLHNCGFSAIALLSSSHKNFRNWFYSLNRKIIKVEDDHGSSLGPYEALQIPSYRVDLGDCTDDEILDITKEYQQEKHK